MIVKFEIINLGFVFMYNAYNNIGNAYFYQVICTYQLSLTINVELFR